MLTVKNTSLVALTSYHLSDKLLDSYYPRNVTFLFESSSFICLKVRKKTPIPELLLAVVNLLGDSAVACERGTRQLQDHFRGNRLKMFSPHISHCTYFVNLTTVPFKHFLSHIQVSRSGEKHTDRTPDSTCTVNKC